MEISKSKLAYYSGLVPKNYSNQFIEDFAQALGISVATVKSNMLHGTKARDLKPVEVKEARTLALSFLDQAINVVKQAA